MKTTYLSSIDIPSIHAKLLVTLFLEVLILAQAGRAIATESAPQEANLMPAATSATIPLQSAPEGAVHGESPSLAPVAVPAQVRIGVKLTPFRQIVTKGMDGKSQVQHVAEVALKHTLRARLNKVNHFYVGTYHLETRPLKWERESKHYEVQITIYRQFGRDSEVEETIGALTVSGELMPQGDSIYVLGGSAYKRFRDKFNAPVIDVAAGLSPANGATANGAAPAKTGATVNAERF